MRLHKYLYANANPVSNSDPTGYFSLVGIIGGSKARAELDSITTPNYAGILGYLLRKIATFAIEIIKREVRIFLFRFLLDVTIGNVIDHYIMGAIEEEVHANLEKALSDDRRLEKNHQKNHRHHIVAQKHPEAALGRSILKFVLIGIDSDKNTVWIREVFHWFLHNGSYHFAISYRLFVAYDRNSSWFSNRILYPRHLKKSRIT